MRTFLAIRFSAMGDVLLILPVLAQATEQNSDVRFVVLTRPKFAVFFEGYERISVFSADVDHGYKGLLGLWKLVRKLKGNFTFDAILDLHEHLRSKIIKTLFFGVPKYSLDKGRADKKAITRRENKVRKHLPHATARYAAVLRMAGIRLENFASMSDSRHPGQKDRISGQGPPKNYFKDLPKLPIEKKGKWIGIAPFAQHKGKMWPFEKVRDLIGSLPEQCTVLLFGGGPKEVQMLRPLADKCEQTVLVAGQFPLKTELSLISALDIMFCMDSSNMHMAALAGVPTVSVWGATHPDTGFGPFGFQAHQILQIPIGQLPCRPCSVYGNKPCFRGDYACLNSIDKERVLHWLY